MVDLYFYRDPVDVERQEQDGGPQHEVEYDQQQQWGNEIDNQPKQQQQPPQQPQQWGPTEAQTTTTTTAETDWEEPAASTALQPVVSQSFLPTATDPNDNQNWGDDNWN